MARYSVTFVCIVLMLGFGIFFGIELATRGIERIQGPINGYAQVQQQPAPANPGAAPQAGAAAGTPGQNASSVPAAAPVKPKPQPQPPTGDSGINRAGNQIGDMLQSAAHGTIRTIVSLFDSIVN